MFVTMMACESNPEFTQLDQDFIYQRINPDFDNGSIDVLNTVLKRFNPSGRSITTYLGEVDLKEAIRVEDKRDGAIRYTYQFIGSGDLNKNLVIKVRPDGKNSGYIMTYYPNKEWATRYNTMEDYLGYTGQIVFTTLDGWDKYWIEFINGSGTIYLIKDPVSRNGRSECDGIGSGTGGGGNSGDGSGYDSGNDGAPAGFGEFSWGYGIIGGHTGGAAGNDDSEDSGPVINNDLYDGDMDDDFPPGGEIITRSECDTEPNPEGNCTDDNCPPAPIGTYPPDLNLCSINSCISESCPNYDSNECEDCYALDENLDCIPESDYWEDQTTSMLCGDANFKLVGSGFTAEISNLGLHAINQREMKMIDVSIFSSCVTIPSHNVSNGGQAAKLFAFAFNNARQNIYRELSTNELEETSFAVRRRLVELIRHFLSDVRTGSTYTTSGCSGNIPISDAKYDC